MLHGARAEIIFPVWWRVSPSLSRVYLLSRSAMSSTLAFSSAARWGTRPKLLPLAIACCKKTTEKGYMEIRGRTDYLKTDVTLAIWSRNFIARQYRKCDMPCRTLQLCRINKNWLISVRRLFATKLHRIIERCSNRIRSCSAYKAKNILFLRTLLPKKPKIERMGQRTGHTHPHVNITCEMRQRKRHARDAPFVKSLGVWT